MSDSGESNSDKDDKQNITKQVTVRILFVLYGTFGFVAFEIVFGEFVFNVDLCKILNENYKCEFETEFSKYDDIFNGYYPPPHSTPIPSPTTHDFTSTFN